MAAHPEPTRPLYGMVTNGSSFLFLKTVDKQYGISDLFAARSPYRNNLSEVLKILKYLDCTDRLFLQRVGGRYRFNHKLLQDHFAELATEQ
ncbi:hypothetical protein [Pseudanabaena sp. PCC 6802]|uniref:hypothetical protein n=1 Tax=Pseudanabaena sp. PCC 6802 TaxID=118173 RepID=UPI000476F03D|nr:hypothetical protein [Pseudanabaena sp. PCC 6802]